MVNQQQAEHRTILVVDVEGFGDRRRTNPQQVAVRKGLYGALERAFDNAGIAWSDCYCEDRGDGVLILAPAEMPKGPFAEPLPRMLAEALREHNDAHPEEEQIRLRMALHAGEVIRDDHGAAAEAINLASRLIDAAQLKVELVTSPGVLALIVSSWFFDEVIRQTPACSPATYRLIRAVIKNTSTHAWICLPDHPFSPREPNAM
jgi:class 3 adenylate cyclase